MPESVSPRMESKAPPCGVPTTILGSRSHITVLVSLSRAYALTYTSRSSSDTSALTYTSCSSSECLSVVYPPPCVKERAREARRERQERRTAEQRSAAAALTAGTHSYINCSYLSTRHYHRPSGTHSYSNCSYLSTCHYHRPSGTHSYTNCSHLSTRHYHRHYVSACLPDKL